MSSKMSARTNESKKVENGPTLPHLYFQSKNNHTQGKRNLTNESDLALSDLPVEMMSHVASFLDWGDYARLSCANSTYKNIVRDAAVHGGRDSQWELVEALLEGKHGLSQNLSLAFEYLRDLSGLEDIDLETNIHAMFDECELQSSSFNDRETNDREDNCSVEMKRPQEHDVFPPAMRKLATCYLNGSGVEQDNVKGLQWLKAAYTYGNDMDAAYEIATIYEYGKYSVTVDVVLAAKWFLLAAKGGHVEAMAEYAMCCELGCGVEMSDDDALEWYTRAARLGHVTSNYSVGEIFEEARGVPQSDSEAVLWYYKAALMGDSDSKRALYRLSDIARIVIPGFTNILNGKSAGNAQ